MAVIRKKIRDYLNREYDIKAKFLPLPFYSYKKSGDNAEEEEEENHGHDGKTEAISISRIKSHKNIDMILRAYKETKKNPIKIYGFFNSSFVFSSLEKLDFEKHYQGMFDKSFRGVSAILSKSKFIVDLSDIPNDGGGTQYTLLDAIYNNSAIVLNRKWIETVDKKYLDFKEGYNCYAVSNEQELAELIENAKC